MRRHNPSLGPSLGPFSRIGELFDASALGLVTLLLLGVSFYATWQGLSDFIISRTGEGQAGARLLVVLVVLTLTLAMYVALREMVTPIRRRNILIAFPLYALLALWSVGFGYGFWWSLVAGQDATERALSRTVTSLGEATSELRADLAAGAALMDTAERLSDEKAEREIARGGTCGVASGAGDGPLSRARAETRIQIAAFAASVEQDWLAPVNARLTALETSADFAGPANETPEVRKQRMTGLGARVRRVAQDISADAAARGRILAEQLRAKAQRLSVAPVSGVVDYCYDPDLATSLTLVADAIDGPFDIEVTAFRFAEGADGVAQAVEDLWLGVFAKLGLVKRSTATGPLLDGRSLIALVAAIGVDLALFVFALLRGGMRLAYDPVLPPATPVVPVKPDAPIEGGSEVNDVLAAPAPKPALPSPQDSSLGHAEAKTDTRLFGAGDVRDAEFVEPKGPGLSETFTPDSQLSDEEQLASLLKQAQVHLSEMQTAGSTSSKMRARNRLSDTLRHLKEIGYHSAGMDDVTYKPDLHESVGDDGADVENGEIVRIVRPRFMAADGQVLLRALVIVAVPKK